MSDKKVLPNHFSLVVVVHFVVREVNPSLASLLPMKMNQDLEFLVLLSLLVKAPSVNKVVSYHKKKKKKKKLPNADPPDEQLKNFISTPFDFYHLTHTSPAQFQSLDKVKESDLVAEFHAFREAQMPKQELKHIHADDLRSHSISAARSSASLASDAQSVNSPEENLPPSLSPGLRNRSCSVMNFSRPISRQQLVRSPPSSSSAVSLPQLSSTNKTSDSRPRAIDDILGLHTPRTYPEHVYTTDEDYQQMSASMAQITLDGIIQQHNNSRRNSSISSTSSSNSTRAQKSNHYNSSTLDLDDVPEEDELIHAGSYRNSLLPPPLRPPPPPPLPPELLSTYIPDAPIPLAVTSPEFGSGHYTEEKEQESPVNDVDIHKEIIDSWDDDIDFCYEHAAESTCNFDWVCIADNPQPDDVKTDEDPLWKQHPGSNMKQPSAGENRTTQKGQGPYENVRIRSSGSGSEGRYSQRSQESQEDQRVIVDLPIPHMHDRRTPSKFSSEESLVLWRAGSAACKECSSPSTNSVPDLIHSRTGSQEERVAEQPSISISPRTSTSPSVPTTIHEQSPPSSSSSHHRQTKSLVPGDGRSNNPGQILMTYQQHARSSSEGATRQLNQAIDAGTRGAGNGKSDQQYQTRKRSGSSCSKAAGRRKGKPSYSLFPTSSQI